MTDTEMQRRKAICDVAGVDDIGELSDGFHTFNQLYYQRMMLFATIVKQNKDRAWKSLRHEDGEFCFGGGWFVVGIDTPEGSYTYHYEDIFYSLFDCIELERGKHWDGHTEKDVTRLLSLPSAQPEQNNASEFWRKRADFYADMCMKLIGEMGKGVQIASVKISANGIEFIKELPPEQPKAIRPKFVAEDRYIKNHFQIFPHCPKCDYELETGDCYCRVCGCHIDWSEEDE